MTRQPVDSSNIASIGYANGTLEVEFVSGAVWQYAGVPQMVATELMHADSVGRYFAQSIKPVYDGALADPAATADTATGATPIGGGLLL